MLRSINRWSILVAVTLMVLTAVVVGWTTYVASRLVITYTLDTREKLLEVQVSDLRSKLSTEQAVQNVRIEQLERFVFEDLAGARPSVIDGGPQAWQKNRDADLRRQLRDLQLWRLKVDGERKQP
jgi:hypothetical protein